MKTSHFTRECYISKMSALAALIILGSLQIPSSAPAQQSSKPLTPVFMRNFGSDKEDLTAEAAAFAVLTRELLVVAAKPPKGKAGPSEHVLLRISAEGHLNGQVKLFDAALPDGPPDGVQEVSALGAMSNGELLVIAVTVDGRIRAFKYTRGGSERVASFPQLAPPAMVTRIVPMDAGLLVLGHESWNAIAILVDQRGNIVWRRSIDRGQQEVFWDAVQTDGGGFLGLSNSGKYSGLFNGPSRVSLSQFGRDGKVSKEHEFPGHYGQVGLTRTGCLIVYDASTTTSQDIRLRSVSQDLSLNWEAPLGNFPHGFQLFSLSSLADGGALVGGAKSALPWIALADSHGKIRSSYLGESQDRAFGHLYLAADQILYSISSVLSVKDVSGKRRIDRSIKVMKFVSVN